MADHRLGSLLQYLNRTNAPAPPDDGRLLEQFLAWGDQAAFAALVERHGPMVLGVCRRALDHPEDAEDAFQATFLVLARKAGSIRRRAALGSWLYGVAAHLARKVRASRLRRQAHERKAAPVSEPTTAPTEPSWDDLRPVLDEELGRLPEKYRTPLVLCYLEGRTNEEAAEQLHWRPGTVKSRLARGRTELRRRLARRGLALPATALASLLAEQALAHPVPAALAAVTARTAALLLGGRAAVAASAPLLLADRLVRTLVVQRWATAAAFILALCLAGRVGWLAAQGGPVPPPKDAAPAAAPAPAVAEVNYPRRLFAVGVGAPLYAPPTDLGAGARSAEALVHRLGDLLRVPDRQRAWLSDQAAAPVPPLKLTILHNLDRFVWTSREQDRVVVLFVGNAVVIGQDPYLVPLDGDPADARTLISLRAVYDRLERCKARQKVLILDVCRDAPMSRDLDDALAAPPQGVQVLAACVAGQRSLAPEGDADLRGGVLLNQFLEVQRQGDLRDAGQAPEDSLPVGHLADELRVRTTTLVRDRFKAEQTVRLTGEEGNKALEYDPKAALPERLTLEGPDRPSPALREKSRALCKAIAAQVGLAAEEEDRLLRTADLGLWSDAALSDLKRDDHDADLRKWAADLVSQIRQSTKDGEDLPLQFRAPPDDRDAINDFREELVGYSKKTGLLDYRCGEMGEDLRRALAAKRFDDEAFGDKPAVQFLQARLLACKARLGAYNDALAQMRKEFPPRDPATDRGWRLRPTRKSLTTAVEKDLKQAHKLWDDMIQAYRGTPWEYLARVESHRPYSLEWEPLPR